MELTSEEIALVEAHRASNRKPDWQPKLAADYTPEEKCAAFDKLHQMALDEYKELLEKGWANEDWRAYKDEAVTKLLGEGVWDAWRQLIG